MASNNLARIITPWQPNPHRSFILTNANLINPVTGDVTRNTTIHLSGGLVASVTVMGDDNSSTSNPPAPTHNRKDAITIDLDGKYVCPGLIDSHVHLAAVPGATSLTEMKDLSPNLSLLRQPYLCQSMLDRGFTTVRDCGGATLALKESIQQGLIRGPRLFIAGHALSQTGGHGDRRSQHDPNECCAGHVNGIGRIVDGVAECLKH
ncbi:hypothetical protein BJX65DRAFT_315372 [Aspergillus insuetus]